jgi:sortase A
MTYSVKTLVRIGLIVGLMLLGVIQLGHGSYIKMKAVAADLLITTTWLNREEGAMPVKPWPWADTWVIGRIDVPRLAVEQFIMKDLSGESLAFGPGILDTLPSGSNYKLIAGHRDTHFDFVADLIDRDVINFVGQDGKHQSYEVIDTRIFDSSEGPLLIEPDNPGLMLVTCWPFDSLNFGGPLRYLVEAVPAG